ncbi:Got1-domain-containing protein [Rozella allomycis CSF55]|uniref:Got1-domain-containing protein n=1 Tax=Rozella allomycis (strain CSF55) TaxID=988480 RepID=A0A075AN26_ROZAC|nr:hypothetical protein O9G_001062 [Rozella allomycis CSF55]RKP19568.1 Got1-domain-containing protein [Rozella allomycis CSF55]|eukprot:EPZ31151.1 hypothetical protein O9G_001062 [Rozella allomycis CSF55]
MFLSEAQRVGLTAFGVFFMFLGVILLFDSGLLAIGNLLFLIGIVLIIGPKKTSSFFLQKNKWKGTACFLFGILLVFFKFAVFGILIELFGFINLFGDFFPMVFSFLRRLPIVGNILAPLEKVFGYINIPV